MDGRKRTVQIKFRVTEAERDLILERRVCGSIGYTVTTDGQEPTLNGQDLSA